MATPDLPNDDLGKHLRTMEARIERLEKRSPFSNTGITIPAAGEVDIAGILRILGLTVVDADGGIQSSNYVGSVAGWRSDGLAVEINTGVIGNNALANPVTNESPRTAVGNFSLTTAYTTLASTSTTVPIGFTTLHAEIFCRMYAVNPNAGADALYVRAILGTTNITTATPCAVLGSNGFNSAIGFGSFDLTGLTGGTVIPIAVSGRTATAAMAANVGNFAEVVCSLSWTR